MNKRIPLFSVLAVVYAVFDLVKIIRSVSQVLSPELGLLLNPMQSVLSLVPEVAHAVLVIVLAVMAVLIVSKPEWGKYAGWIALVWSGWGCINLVRSLLAGVASGFDNTAVLVSICSSVSYAIVLVVWLIVSVTMVTGKEVKKVPLSLTHLASLGAVMILVGALPTIFGGNQNVAAIMIEGILAAVPMVAMYAAGWLLQDAFTHPEKTPLMTGEVLKYAIVVAVTAAISMALFYACEKPKDDGKEYGICPNCYTRMETKYIRNGQCTRCDGQDWYD